MSWNTYRTRRPLAAHEDRRDVRDIFDGRPCDDASGPPEERFIPTPRLNEFGWQHGLPREVKLRSKVLWLRQNGRPHPEVRDEKDRPLLWRKHGPGGLLAFIDGVKEER